MPPPDLVELFAVPLDRLRLDYFVTGAVASVVYGEPRLTRDLDVVLDLRPDHARRLVETFSPEAFYVPPREVIESEARRTAGGHFNLLHHDTGLRADCYLAGDDPLHAWAFERRERTDVGGTAIWIAPMEYVILRKLEWYRTGGATRHLDDIRAMLRVSGDRLKRQELEPWIAHLGLTEPWRTVRDSTPR